MSEVHPFQALRYNARRVDLGRVIVPPYDVIAAEDREAFFERDPHNAIRLELTRDVKDQSTTDYAQIPRALAAWRESGVLLRDPRPGFYPLRQSFTAPDGTHNARLGFFGLLRLEDYASRVVRPHERTLEAPKADRLKALRAARGNLSSVLLLYEDRGDELAKVLAPAFDGATLCRARDEAGTTHELARLAEPEQIEAIRAFMADRPLVIADGHHRYETALNYRNEQRVAHPDAGPSAPWEFILVYLANAFAPGSLLLPIHRLIVDGAMPSDAEWSERLPGWSQTTVPIAGAGEILDLLARHLTPLSDRRAFAVDDASGTLRIFSRPADDDRELSIRVLHTEVIAGVFGLDEAAVAKGAIDYPKSAVQTAKDLRKGRGAVALYVNPLAPDDVFRVTEAGDVLPQKSTFFYPKLPTGLVFNLHEEPA
jgi:uncharacterized protein (DUF1015 family)